MDIILPQIIAIGIYNSQIAVNGASITKKRKTKMFEIELPIDSGGFSFIDNGHSEITPNTLICAKPSQTRHTLFPFKCYYIHMILKEGRLYELFSSLPDYLTVDNPSKYQELFAKLYGLYESATKTDEIMIYSLILELAYHLKKDAKKQIRRNSSGEGNYEVIEGVITYIKNNLTGDLSLKSISSYANLSPIHFHNCFKSATGRTLHEFVEEQRIKKASELLITTDWTLTRISGECGFSSQSYFSYAFKRKMNMTPREYAKKVYKRYDS